jgi:glyoxylase-like metal-dependent hydrolase (beta-lactamase superfamily II)
LLENVSRGIFAFISATGGSNVFLVRGLQETALVDSSTEDNKDALITSLKEIGLNPGSISLVLHTHGHADHFGNDCLFPKAKIAMHMEDAKRINAADREFACLQFFPGTKLPKVSLFLKAGQTLDLGGISLQAIHAPGHTAGSTCFFEPAKKLFFSGDTLFADGIGRTDFPSGNGQKMAESLKMLKKTPFKAILPGHGPLVLGKAPARACLSNALETALTNTFL